MTIPFPNGGGIFDPIFLSHFLTKMSSIWAHQKGSFLNFSKLKLLLSGECQVNVKSQSEFDIGERETCLLLVLFGMSDNDISCSKQPRTARDDGEREVV